MTLIKHDPATRLHMQRQYSQVWFVCCMCGAIIRSPFVHVLGVIHHS